MSSFFGKFLSPGGDDSTNERFRSSPENGCGCGRAGELPQRRCRPCLGDSKSPINKISPIGATGADCAPGASSFAYFSAMGEQTVEPGDPVAFNQPPMPAELPSDFSFIAPSQIIVNTAGLYGIKYYLMPQKANTTLAVFNDGVEAPISRYTSRSSAGHVRGEFPVNVTLTPAVITLVNVDPRQSAVTANGQLDGTVSASLIISKVN